MRYYDAVLLAGSLCAGCLARDVERIARGSPVRGHLKRKLRARAVERGAARIREQKPPTVQPEVQRRPVRDVYLKRVAGAGDRRFVAGMEVPPASRTPTSNGDVMAFAGLSDSEGSLIRMVTVAAFAS